jgi:cytochrome c-type biogenesis protein CcmH
MRRIFLLGLLGLLALALPGVAWAQAERSSPAIEDATRRLATELRCPVCQGLSIEDSPDALAMQMKDVIRQQLIDGSTPEEVRAFFVSRYGEWILLKPEPRGFNLAVYLLPLLVALAGAGLLALRVRQWTHSAEPEARADGEPVELAGRQD